MKKYFYAEGDKSYGPFSIEELKEKNISKETLVWFEELGDWKPAGSVDELKEIFKLTPPPLAKKGIPNEKGESSKSSPTHVSQNNLKSNKMENTENQNQKPPKTWLVESILVTLFCCLPFGIAGIVNAARVESRFYAGDVEGSQRASDQAGKWTKIGFWIGLAVIVLYIIFVVVLGVGAGVGGRKFY